MPSATAPRPATAADTMASLWEYQQIQANYRFVPSKTPLGFTIQMQQADEYGHFGTWQTTDSVPAIVVGSLLERCGLLPARTQQNSSPARAAAAATTATVTKAPTATASKASKVSVSKAASR